MWFRRAVVGGHARVAAATSAGFVRRTAMPRLVQMHSVYQQQHFQQQQQQQRGRWCSQQPPIQPPSLQSLDEVDAEFTEKAVEILDEVDKDIAGAWDTEIREPAVLFKVIQAMDLYSKGMDRGSARAANDLAVIYHAGRGIPPDYNLAEECYSRALELLVARQKMMGETPDERNAFLCTSYAALLQQLDEPRHEDAITLLQQAYDFDRDNTGIQVSLGDAHVRAASLLVSTNPAKAADLLTGGADHFAAVWGEDNVTSEAIRKDAGLLRAEASKL